MDKFKNRIKYYLVGFTFGIAAVIFFFGQRGCSWLPNNRVKTTITEQDIMIGDSLQSILDCLGPDSEPIFKLLNNDGDVDFANSDTRANFKIYYINGENDLRVGFKMYDNYSEIISIEQPGLNCKAEGLNNRKRRLMLPKVIIDQIIGSHRFTLYEVVNCQIECFNIPVEVLYSLHLTGYDYETPKHKELVNKRFKLSTEYQGKTYRITYEIGENRTRVKNISGEKECACE